MSQHGFASLSASLRNGGDLTPILEAIQTAHLGTTRPTYATQGMIWLKDLTATLNKIEVYLYDGTVDILMGTFDLATGEYGAAGIDGLVSAKALGGILLGAIAANVGPSGFTGLDGHGLIFNRVRVYNDTTNRVLQARYTDDNGASWGSFQTIYTYPGTTFEHSTYVTINLETGAYNALNYGRALTTSDLSSGTHTVPANCNGFQFQLGNPTGTRFMDFISFALGGLET